MACSTPAPSSPRSSSIGACAFSPTTPGPIATGRLSLVQGDALDQDLNRGPAHDVVANLPYHITSPILHRLLEDTRVRIGSC